MILVEMNAAMRKGYKAQSAHENHHQRPYKITCTHHSQAETYSQIHAKSVKQDQFGECMFSLLGHPLPIATPK